MSWAGIILTFALVDNVILSRLLGLDPRQAPPEPRSAVVLGVLVAVLMAFSALGGWLLDSVVLTPLGFSMLLTPGYVLLVAGFAVGLEAILARTSPGLLRAAAVSLPRVAVNCVVLGLILVTTRAGYGAGEAVVAGIAAGAGYLAVSAMMSAIRERLDVERVPPAMRGFPLQLLTAGLMAFAFMAFDRAFLARLLGG